MQILKIMHKKKYYINGKYVIHNDAKIAFSDSAFLYGDGLFETIRFQNRKLFAIEKHLKRLKSGLEVLNLKYNKADREIIHILESVIKKKLA